MGHMGGIGRKNRAVELGGTRKIGEHLEKIQEIVENSVDIVRDILKGGR